MILPWCGVLEGLHNAWSCFTIKAHPICSPSSQMKLIWADFLRLRSTDACWCETPTTQSQRYKDDAVALLWIVLSHNLSNLRKEVAASRSQRSCELCFMSEGQTHNRHMSCMYIFTRMHIRHIHTPILPAHAIISDTNPLWWCLDYIELSWCDVSPSVVRTFISIPKRLLLPFVRVIYTAVYAHTTCKPAVPPCKENVM